MKCTTLISCTVLILGGLCAAFYALAGIDLLRLIPAEGDTMYRILLSLAGVSALWLLFWLIVFRPTRPLR